MRRHSECAFLLYVLSIAGYVVFCAIYLPINLGHQFLAMIKRRYETFLETFDGWA